MQIQHATRISTRAPRFQSQERRVHTQFNKPANAFIIRLLNDSVGKLQQGLDVSQKQIAWHYGTTGSGPSAENYYPYIQIDYKTGREYDAILELLKTHQTAPVLNLPTVRGLRDQEHLLGYEIISQWRNLPRREIQDVDPYQLTEFRYNGVQIILNPLEEQAKYKPPPANGDKSSRFRWLIPVTS